MNKTHRVVWNCSRNAFVVAHEFAATSGKPSTRKSAVAKGVAAALLLLAAGEASAQTVFMTPGQTIVNTTTITGTSGYPGISLGPGTTAGAITNSGLIQGSPSAGDDDQLDGIFVSGTLTGGITNSPTGAITGAQNGIAIMTGGSVSSILNTGSINSNNQGIYVSASSITGNINNSGSITGGDDGIAVQAGATVTSIINSGSGFIHGGSTGIQVEGAGASVASIVNSGSLSVISGGTAGIFVGNGAIVGSISNAGTVTAGSYGILVRSSTLTAGITNSGLISGTDNTGIVLQGASVGTLSNLLGATITGTSYGVNISASSLGQFLNAGLITGGIGVFVMNSTVTGGMTNSGQILATNTSLSAGIFASGSTISGGIKNLAGGVLSGASGISLYSSKLDTLSNAGTLSGLVDGIGVYGSTLSGLGATAAISNSGAITGSYAGVIMSNSTVAGGIVNSGLISGTTYAGVILGGALVTGGITNLAGGVISGASGIAVYRGLLDFIYNAAGATITGLGGPDGSESGILLSSATLSGGISNAGVIHGVNYGINLESGATVAGAIINSGTISGGRVGVGVFTSSTVVGGLTNSGLISGTTYAGMMVSGSTISGAVSNLSGGTITGGEGILLYQATVGSISNAAGAKIIATATNGIDVSNATVTGAIINAGTITAPKAGISMTTNATVGGGLINSGVIAGGPYAVYVDATSSLGPITISGNTARFIGDVYAPASAVTLTSGSSFTGTNAFNVASFSIDPTATLMMGAMASTAADAAGITTSQGVNNAGTLGVGLGTAHITGSYTQASSGTFSMGAKSASQYGQLAVNGAVSLPAAASIFVNVAGNEDLPNKGTLVGVISGTSLTASTFDVTDNSALFKFTGKIDGNGVDLVIAENALVLPDVIANHNTAAIGAATVLDEIIETSGTTGAFGSVIDAIARLQTSQQVSNAASETLPLLSGDSNVAVLGTLYDIDHIVQSRTGNYGLSSGDPYMLSDRGAWVKPFGSWASQDEQNSAPGFTAQIAGIALGADGAFSPQGRVGLAFAYADTGVQGSGSQTPNSNHIDLYQFIGYGSYTLDALTEVNWQLDGGMNTNTGSRSINLISAIARSSYDSNTAHAGIGIGRNLPFSDATVITPSIRVDYTWIHDDAYTEGGAGPLDLHVQSASLEQLLTSVNAKITQRLTDSATIYGNLGVGYDSLARGTEVTAAYAGAPGLAFATPGVGTKPWTGFGGFGLLYTPKGGPEISVGYDIANRSGFNEQSVSAKLRWAF